MLNSQELKENKIYQVLLPILLQNVPKLELYLLCHRQTATSLPLKKLPGAMSWINLWNSHILLKKNGGTCDKYADVSLMKTEERRSVLSSLLNSWESEQILEKTSRASGGVSIPENIPHLLQLLYGNQVKKSSVSIVQYAGMLLY